MPPSFHSPAMPPSRPGPHIPHFSVQLYFATKYNFELSHAPLPSRCTVRSCVLRRTPTLGLRHLRAMRLRLKFSAGALPGAPAHPACCSHLRACSVLQHDCFFPPNRCYAHLLGTVAVAMASSRHPSPRPRCLPHSGTRIPCPPSGLRPQRFAHILRDSASRGAVLMCSSGPAPVFASLCCRTRACRPCPAPVLQSPIRRSSHAATRPLSCGRSQT